MNRKNGFSLVELMVVLAVIAMLIGLSSYGVSLAMRNSRESIRTELLGNIKLEIENYYLQYGSYPANSAISFSNGKFQICNTTKNICKSVTAAEKYTVPTLSTNNSTTTQTAFCYSNAVSDRQYVLGFKTEIGDWRDIGSSKTYSCKSMSTDGNFSNTSIVRIAN